MYCFIIVQVFLGFARFWAIFTLSPPFRLFGLAWPTVWFGFWRETGIFKGRWPHGDRIGWRKVRICWCRRGGIIGRRCNAGFYGLRAEIEIVASLVAWWSIPQTLKDSNLDGRQGSTFCRQSSSFVTQKSLISRSVWSEEAKTGGYLFNGSISQRAFRGLTVIA